MKPTILHHGEYISVASEETGNFFEQYRVGEICWWFPYYLDDHESVMTLENPILANAYIFGNPLFADDQEARDA